jgi:gliding motility-associated-like protein
VNGCISYTAGAIEGIDSVCVQVCNAAGTSCDTTVVYVFVQSPTDTFRTILQTNQTTNLCPVLTALPNAPTSTTDLNCRPIRFGTINSINATTSCVNYTAGTTMGYDTVCVLSCDAQGFCDTAVLIFQIQSPSDTSTFNVRTNTEGTFCPNISSFSNPIVTVTDLNCTTIDGGVINGINTANGCVRYQAGNLAGLDTVCLVVCDAQGFCDTTVVYFNVVPAPDTVRLNFLPGDAAVDTCPYNIQNRGTLAAVTNLGCDMSTVGTITVNSTTGCVNYVPAIPQPGSGTRSDTACVVLCDNTNPTAYCDTVIYIFNNIEPTCGGTVPDILSYQVQDCATQVQVCLPIPLDSVPDYDVLINGVAYNNGYTGCAFVTKVQYPVVLVPACAADFFVSWTVNGVVFGPTQVTGFAGVVNQLNTWDTRTVWSLSPNGSVINGTNFGNDSISYGNLSIRCVSGGNPTLLGATTQQQYADGSNIQLNGLGNYRLTVIDQFGCVDTSLIRVVCVQSSIVLDTVFLDSVRTNCNIDLSQVAQVQTIQNACTPNGNLSLQLNPTTRCLTFTGARVGADTTCVVVCDSFGICDTTYFIVQIRVPSPIAFMDTMLIPFATNTGSKSVCLNDTIPNTTFTINIITQPTLGTLVSNGCTQTFTRSTPQTCGRDSFQYEIQNAGGSSRAWVYLDIRCKPFSISEGLSPNGDGLNDRFVINSLQNYPNHELYIYNRWGSQVFRTKNYQNDWEGTFIGNPLPDGTYYYLIEMNDDLNQVFTGYFILLR